MPIPQFDGITNVIPPCQFDPRNPSDLTPYICTFEEVCQRFATAPERIEILRGCLAFRQELVRRGVNGFQWLDGSFVEDIEAQEGRSPQDIDVVTVSVLSTRAGESSLWLAMAGQRSTAAPR